MNFNKFENFPTAGTPTGFSKATKVFPGTSYAKVLNGFDTASENSSASEASTKTVTWNSGNKKEIRRYTETDKKT